MRLILFLFTISFFTSVAQTNQQSVIINKIDGVFVFSECKPIAPHDTIGEVSAEVSITGEYPELRDKLVRRAKKKFPTLDGIILNINAPTANVPCPLCAYVIKFR